MLKENEIEKRIKGVIEVKDGDVAIVNEEKLRGELLDELIWEAVFGDGLLKGYIRSLIRVIGFKLGIYPASIYPLYKAIGRGEINRFTVPAINIRGMTYDIARAIFRAIISLNSGALIFEIARSEIEYTMQRPDEYAVVVIASAIKEGYKGPLFIQGDHFQFNLKRFKEDPEKEIGELKGLIREAVEAGFYNIDIDASTLVDLSKPSIEEQQRLNYEMTAELTAFIRDIEPKGETISVGGEIGEVGGHNSTVEEFVAFMEGYNRKLKELKGEGCVGLSKISVQTGTTHGGVVLPDGSIKEVDVDFGVLQAISDLARNRYHLSGAVQHGASTLPESLFHKFPESGTSEIHLATGFQNIVYDHPEFPLELKEKIYSWLKHNFRDEWKEGISEEQFIYRVRKRGWGYFKKEIWGLPEEIKSKICNTLEEKFVFLFKELKINDTKKLVENYIKPNEVIEEGFAKKLFNGGWKRC